MFGLGRSEKVRSIMRTLLKLSRHGLGDIADSCWEFVKGCGAYAEPKEREYAEKRLQEASDHGIEMGKCRKIKCVRDEIFFLSSDLTDTYLRSAL